MNIKTDQFGRINNEDVHLVTITNDVGNAISITNYGGIVHSWLCADNQGNIADVLLGCATLEDYTQRHPYFGAIVGRFANRIRNGKFILNETDYQLSINLPPHHLHGGNEGFDRKIWKMRVEQGRNESKIHLSATSNHMEEGYPGHLNVNVSYTFTNDNELIMEFEATTDRTTIVNLCNHCYFNLSGDQSRQILDHQLLLHADGFTVSDEDSIATGEVKSVENTSLDFRTFRSIGEGINLPDSWITKAKGYDYNFMLNAHLPDKAVAILKHEGTGRILEVFTDQPGIQLYSGNWLEGSLGKSGKYQDYSGVCLETQHVPNSPNLPNFPSTVLQPGETYYTKTIYKIGILQ
jgi:aldose 1-epimerase